MNKVVKLLVVTIVMFAALCSCKMVGVYSIVTVENTAIGSEGKGIRSPYYIGYFNHSTIELDWDHTLIYPRQYRGCCSAPVNNNREVYGKWKRKGDTLTLQYNTNEYARYIMSPKGDTLRPLLAGQSSTIVYVRKKN